ncbi:heterogeneous nuclear ribonucleoprotein 1-like isoform X2 [Impatiens glandulifera]|nr:heterogeneous nuclear ribonucleoprotein 1-like isoform X2 [Impatiens glandulifera]XP_047310808.1 heterogeneous nuclear ribonucleoprotein 1-like isoform X2 [Impatiens glandulifera]
MQSDLGKLFIGGISWDTNEDSLKDYFSGFGEVLEAVIMKDRNTGRARGFGFIVFSDPVVVERVINEKHIIDGRMVEAKKAVPREDHQNTMMMSRSSNSSSIHGSPLQQGGRTRKIFVGGLASSVTEAEFKIYFEQYGTITDVVVMYDHNTHRPRGFGFITFDSEDAVDKVLLKTFHELNGKVVEVKRAVPKELSPGGGPLASRGSPLSGYSYFNQLNRINSFLDGYNNQGFSPSSGAIGYGLRMDDGRFSPIGAGRSGFGPFGSMNFESGLNASNFGGNATSLINSNSYGRGGGMNHPYFNSNNNNRFANPIGYDGGSGGSSSFFSSASRNLWGGNSNNNSGGLNYGANSSGYLGNGSGMIGGNLGNSGINWDSNSHLTNQNGGNILGHVGNLDYGLRGGGAGGGGYDRISSSGTTIGDPMSNAGYDGAFSDLYNSSSSVYGDPTWNSSNLEREGSGSFDYELGNGGGRSDVQTKGSHGFVGGGYSVAKTQSNRG